MEEAIEAYDKVMVDIKRTQRIYHKLQDITIADFIDYLYDRELRDEFYVHKWNNVGFMESSNEQIP